MSIVRVGATKKFSENWDSIFTKGSKKSAKTAKPAKKAAKPVASPKKAAGKKKAKKR